VHGEVVADQVDRQAGLDGVVDPVEEVFEVLSRVPDPAVTAETAQAADADTASKALAAGDLHGALAALDTAREQAAQGRRVLKAAASGRHAPATRPGGLRDLEAARIGVICGTCACLETGQAQGP
jgi:hypothetical protein